MILQNRKKSLVTLTVLFSFLILVFNLSTLSANPKEEKNPSPVTTEDIQRANEAIKGLIKSAVLSVKNDSKSETTTEQHIKDMHFSFEPNATDFAKSKVTFQLGLTYDNLKWNQRQQDEASIEKKLTSSFSLLQWEEEASHSDC